MDVWDFVVLAIVLVVGFGMGAASMLLLWPRDGGDDD